MPIDPSIALQVQPVQLPDFASLAVKRAGVMNAMSEMAARQRALNEQNALATLMQDPAFDPMNPAHQKRAYGTAPNLAPEVLGKIQQTRKYQIEQEAAARAEATAQREQALRDLLTPDTINDTVSSIYDAMNKGVLTKEQADGIVQTLPKDDTGLAAWQRERARKMLIRDNPEQGLAVERTTQDLGDRKVVTAQNRFAAPGEAPVVEAEYDVNMSPSEAAAAETARLNARKLSFQTADGAGVIYGLDPITGKTVSTTQTTPKADKADKSKDTGGFNAREAAANSVLTTISELIGPPGAPGGKAQGGETGLAGQLMANVGGTNAYDVRAALESIKANLGFDRLQQMRDESPTGGALGQVAVQELVALQAALTSLDQGQKTETLRANLEKVRTHYSNWLAAMKQAEAQKTTPAPQGGGAVVDGGVWGRDPKTGKPVLQKSGQ